MYLQSSNLSPPSIVLPVSKVGSIVLLVSKVGSIVLPVSKVGSIVLPVSKVGSNNLCNSLVSKQTISESEAISYKNTHDIYVIVTSLLHGVEL